MVAASQGAQSKFAIEPGAGTPTFDASSEVYEFNADSIRLEATHIDNDAVRGTRSHASATIREGIEIVQGSVTFNPSPIDLDLWLPRILGGSETTDTFPLAETLPAFAMMFDRVAKVLTYTDCFVNKATFKSDEGGLLELTLDIMGFTETVGAAGSFPALTLSTAANNAPYTHTDTASAVTLVSSARLTKSIEIVIDNVLQASHNNSQTPTSITPQNRIITVKTIHPYTSAETDLYAQAVAGAAGSIAYTNGGMSTTFTFANLKVPDNTPVVPSKGEIPLELNMVAYKSGSTLELEVTSDSVA